MGVEHKENIKLDEVMKKLFMVSNPLVVRMVNYFFNERLDEKQRLKVHFKNTESIDENMDLRRADLLINIKETPIWHIEFQLNPSEDMAFRMFQYGYREAIDSEKMKKNPEILCFPKQMVLYLEEGKRAPDELKLMILFPMTDEGEQRITYRILVKKAWEIRKEEKIEKGLYTLLPLEIFKLRRQIEKTNTADGKEYLRLSKEIKTATMEVVKIASQLREENKIQDTDHRKMIDATAYLFEYFTKNFADLRLREEVPKVLESMCDKYENIGMQKGIQIGKEEALQKTAQKMLKSGSPVDFVCHVTELPKETVEKLQKEIEN